ncbi:N-acetylmuramoyl-L-alanine amidase family protein [Luteolibacter soli]|uniref:N-acetylmuramoyl-L-alanine amidase n=1 Tax=Luteolibacter soli TaxID=3135280 RepID=A0ABU9AYA0_9BACT
MKSLPSLRWSGLLGCAAALFTWFLPVIAHAEREFEWHPLKMEGRDYLSAEEIGRFYDLKLRRDGKKIFLEKLADKKAVSISMEVGSPECVMNGLKFIFITPVIEADSVVQISRSDLSRVLDPVLRPELIKTSGHLETVILDPDSGGDDRGTTAGDALQIARMAARDLEAMGFKVVLTRDEAGAVAPEKRLELANAVEGGAAFVGVRFDSGEHGKRGIRTAPLSFHKDAPADDKLVQGDLGPASMALASGVHSSASQMLRMPSEQSKTYMVDLGIQPSYDAVFSKLKHPAIFFSVGCLSDPEDAKLLRNEGYRATLAKSISSGIRRYQAATGR